MIIGRSANLKSWDRVTVAVAIAASVVLTTLSGCNDTGSQLPQHVIHGPLRVRYGIQRTPTEGQSTTGEGARVSEIRFFNDYVIIVSEDGEGGSLYPVSKIKHLSWRKE